VTSVAPFVAVRGDSLRKTTGSGTVSYTARFLGVWDSRGKNVATGGATTITFDAKTGILLSSG